MQGISLREFGKRDGCSDGTVRNGVKNGDLIAFDDGSIDPALVGTPWRRRKPTRNAAQVPHDEAPDGVTFLEAQRRKEHYLAELRRLEFEVKSGRLVDGEKVRTETFNLARGFRDRLANWPKQSAPLIAAELGCDSIALAVAMEKHVREFLSAEAEHALA